MNIYFYNYPGYFTPSSITKCVRPFSFPLIITSSIEFDSLYQIRFTAFSKYSLLGIGKLSIFDKTATLKITCFRKKHVNT